MSVGSNGGGHEAVTLIDLRENVSVLQKEIFGQPGHAGGLKTGHQSLRDDCRTLVGMAERTRLVNWLLAISALLQLAALAYMSWTIAAIRTALQSKGIPVP